MGTLFAFISLLLMIGSIVTAFKPSLIHQESRLKAFVFCWLWSIITALIGQAFDDKIGWGDVAITSAILGVFYVLLTYIIVKIRIARMSPEERVRKLAELQGKPIPFTQTMGTKSDSLQAFEDSLTVMWAGDTKPVEFTYVDRDGDRTRRTLNVEEVSFNDRGQFYLRGICLSRNERRTFKVDNITTKLKVGSNRYDFDEWCVEMLDILPSEGFPQAYFDARA